MIVLYATVTTILCYQQCFVGERQRKRSKVLVTSSNHHELTEQRFLLTFANYDN